MAPPSTEQRELELLDKVDFRIIAASNNEGKLQRLLETYLAPVLLKAGSEHASVRAKVVEISQRLLTFVQPPALVLPVAALLNQYKSQDAPLVRHYDLVFIQHSLGRLSFSQRRELVPVVLRGIGSDTSRSVESLFSIFLRLLPDIKLPSRGSKDDESLREILGLSDPKDAIFVAEWLGKLLLLRPKPKSQAVPGVITLRGALDALAPLRQTDPGPAIYSPGLTDSDVDFLTLHKRDTTWNPDERDQGRPSLAETRVKAVSFLASGAFTDNERFFPAIYAAASTDWRVSSVGDDMLKRTSVSFEDEGLARRLFQAHERLPAPYRIRILNLLSKSKAATRFPDEILAAFKLNVMARATEVDAATRVQTLAASSRLESTKLHTALFEFINWVARMGPNKEEEEEEEEEESRVDQDGDSSMQSLSSATGNSFRIIATSLVTLLQDFVKNQGWPRPDETLSWDEAALRSRAYETIGVFTRVADLSAKESLMLVEWLFRSLAADPTHEVVANIEGALSVMAAAMFGVNKTGKSHKKLTSTAMDLLIEILGLYMTAEEMEQGEAPAPGDAFQSDESAAAEDWANTVATDGQGDVTCPDMVAFLTAFTVRFWHAKSVRNVRPAATKWANQALPFTNTEARWIDLLAVAGRRNERNDVVEEGRRGLDPWTYYANPDDAPKATTLPEWNRMVHQFLSRAAPLPRSLSDKTGRIFAHKIGNDLPVDSECHFRPVNFVGDAIRALPVTVDYCKKILFLTALWGGGARGHDADKHGNNSDVTTKPGLALFKIEPGWERKLEAQVQSDQPTRRAIRNYLRHAYYDSDGGGHNNMSGALQCLLTAAFEGMKTTASATVGDDARAIVEQCARTFVDVASFAPRDTLEPLVSRSFELGPLITSNMREIRTLAAQAFGILGGLGCLREPSASGGRLPNLDEEMAKWVNQVIENAPALNSAAGSALVVIEGNLLALGYLVSRQVYYRHAHQISDDGSNATLVSDSKLLSKDAVPTIESVSSISLSTQETVFETYTQLWTAGVWTLSKRDDPKDLESSISKAYIDPLMLQAKKGNGKAITALGRLAVALPQHPTPGAADMPSTSALVDLILEKLISLHEIKQAEVHFAVGEAIAAAVACWEADVVQLSVDVDASETDTNPLCLVPKRQDRLISTLDRILQNCRTATKPSLLKASGIWLFCVIRNCSATEEVHSRLRDCQRAFMRLLSSRDELVQETASRGLSLVYEKGDVDLRKLLVRDLVSAFTGGKSSSSGQGSSADTQIKMDDDTELFEAGALLTADGKSSITTYRDIVSLANEVGDQSLVYKFMALATNAATWSTRSSFGRFGLSNLLSESGEDAGVDPKLYPKLYRYRFDPNPNVQRSMTDIWKALVKDPNAVLEKHFDAIMTDLLKCILGREWRVREASCAAIVDLVSGRPFKMYETYYQGIWLAALKVLDDVKGTVREAALRMCIALSNTLVRQLEQPGTGSSTSAATAAMMAEALPFLLSEKGIDSGVEDVKVFATITVIKIAKSGNGRALLPFVSDLIPRLLDLLSTIEPEALNYHYLRGSEERRDKIDRLRSSLVTRSPIMEAIEKCLRVTSSVSSGADHAAQVALINTLAPKLESMIKTAIGMPTKLGCARVLETLASKHTAGVSLSGADNKEQPIFASHAARFLQILLPQQAGTVRGILDRNDEVSRAYARAAAFLIRACSNALPDSDRSPRSRLAAGLVDLYIGPQESAAADDEALGRRRKIVDAILALSRVSPDHFGSAEIEGHLLPIAFLARFDEDEYVSKEMDEHIWAQHAGGGGGGGGGNHAAANNSNAASGATAVLRYLDEIAGLCNRALNTAQWTLRRAGALAAAAAVETIVVSGKRSTGQVNRGAIRKLWPVLERGLVLKTWPGKERVLDGLVRVVEAGGGEVWRVADDQAERLDELQEKEVKAGWDLLKKIALREAKRTNDAYRPWAFRCLWRFAAAAGTIDAGAGASVPPDMLDDIRTVAAPFYVELEARDGGDPMDVDEDDSSAANERAKRPTGTATLDRHSETAWAAIEAIAKGYDRRAMRKDMFAELGRVAAALDTGDGSSSPSSDRSNTKKRDVTGNEKKEGSGNRPRIARAPYDRVRRTYWYDTAGEILTEAAEGSGTAGRVDDTEGQDKESNKKTAGSVGGGNGEVLRWWLGTLDLPGRVEGGGEEGHALTTILTEAQRTARAKAVGALAKLTNGGDEGLRADVKKAVERKLDGERSMEVRSAWKECLGVLG